jgi:hypothetical protein
MRGPIFLFYVGRFSAVQVVCDLAFFCAVSMITQKGIILQKNILNKKNPKTLLQEHYFLRFIDLLNFLLHMLSKIPGLV